MHGESPTSCDVPREQRLNADGFMVTEPLLSAAMLSILRDAADDVLRGAGSARAGVRGVVHLHHAFREAAETATVRAMVASVLGAGAFLVRSILFDKTAAANWDVLWHQDVTIAVRERRDVPGFGPWSVKAGVPHVQPPAAVLEEMLTVRLHLDDCGEGNGPLLVVPGSHRHGIVDVRTVDSAACNRAAVSCHLPAGAAVVMRPLLLHASRKATALGRRRVLHLEFAASELPAGLEWARL